MVLVLILAIRHHRSYLSVLSRLQKRHGSPAGSPPAEFRKLLSFFVTRLSSLFPLHDLLSVNTQKYNQSWLHPPCLAYHIQPHNIDLKIRGLTASRFCEPKYFDVNFWTRSRKFGGLGCTKGPRIGLTQPLVSPAIYLVQSKYR